MEGNATRKEFTPVPSGLRTERSRAPCYEEVVTGAVPREKGSILRQWLQDPWGEKGVQPREFPIKQEEGRMGSGTCRLRFFSFSGFEIWG